MAYDEDLAKRIRELVAGEEGLTEMRMFGGLAFLINGNMSVSASGQGGLLLRVDPAETDALAGRPHAQPFECAGGRCRVGCGSTPRECGPSATSSAGRPRGRPRALAAGKVTGALFRGL